jgi:hypothetical protein
MPAKPSVSKSGTDMTEESSGERTPTRSETTTEQTSKSSGEDRERRSASENKGERPSTDIQI